MVRYSDPTKEAATRLATPLPYLACAATHTHTTGIQRATKCVFKQYKSTKSNHKVYFMAIFEQ